MVWCQGELRRLDGLGCEGERGERECGGPNARVGRRGSVRCRCGRGRCRDRGPARGLSLELKGIGESLFVSSNKIGKVLGVLSARGRGSKVPNGTVVMTVLWLRVAQGACGMCVSHGVLC